MANLLRGVGEDSEFRYSPFQASPAALIGYLGVLLCLFGLLLWLGDDAIWPPWPAQGRLHALFWLAVVMLPLMLQQLGWSYALTPSELVVRRFGTDRQRLPLQEYQGTTATMGLVWLRFGNRRLYLVSATDADRQTFLGELEARSRRAVARPAAPLETEAGGIVLAVDALKFPDACVKCGAPADREVSIEASHWFGIPVIQGVEVKAPVCELHHRREWQVRWLVNALLYVVGFAVSVVLMAMNRGSRSVDALFVLTVVMFTALFGVSLQRAARLLHLRSWCGWLSLGLRTGSLSGDLRTLTVYTQSSALRRALTQPLQ